MKTYVVGPYLNCLNEAIPVSSQNVCFHGEIRKISHILVEKSIFRKAMHFPSSRNDCNMLFPVSWPLNLVTRLCPSMCLCVIYSPLNFFYFYMFTGLCFFSVL